MGQILNKIGNSCVTSQAQTRKVERQSNDNNIINKLCYRTYCRTIRYKNSNHIANSLLFRGSNQKTIEVIKYSKLCRDNHLIFLCRQWIRTRSGFRSARIDLMPELTDSEFPLHHRHLPHTHIASSTSFNGMTSAASRWKLYQKILFLYKIIVRLLRLRTCCSGGGFHRHRVHSSLLKAGSENFIIRYSTNIASCVYFRSSAAFNLITILCTINKNILLLRNPRLHPVGQHECYCPALPAWLITCAWLSY